MKEIQTKNDTFIMTENNNTIITYNILGFEIMILNYFENTALVIIYNEESECRAIFRLYVYGSFSKIDIIENTADMPEELINEIVERISNKFEKWEDEED